MPGTEPTPARATFTAPPARPLPRLAPPYHPCRSSLTASRLEKAGLQKQQKALEAQVDKGRRAAEEARARLAEQENAVKQLGLERQASQQDRYVSSRGLDYGPVVWRLGEGVVG